MGKPITQRNHVQTRAWPVRINRQLDIGGWTVASVARARKPTTRQQVINGKRVSRTDWQELRNRWHTRLPQPCPRCDRDVMPWDAWDLDHVGVPVALGATDTEIRPA